jgi:four helix bundle protein
MATIKQFEELEVWQKSRTLVNKIYELSNVNSFSKDFGLKDQMRRASVSIVSNIAEGFERDGRKEFLQYLSIAKGSAGELRAQLYIALDQKYISQAEFENLYDEIKEISMMLKGFIIYLQKSELKGTKYKV